MPDIFLSYSRDDQAIARRFAQGFEHAGLNVWWDATLNPGEAYDKVTENALDEAKAVVVLWSRKSVDSRWVRAEATRAISAGTLVPVMIEACKRPIMFELTHTADLSHWNGDANDKEWLAYLAGVRRFVEKDSLHMELPAEGSQSRARIPDAERLPSIAVLPFANMSGDKEQEYFSDGLAEEIINALVQMSGIRVIARTSAFAFKGQNTDIRQIGRTLGVNHVLEGSVRRAGNRIRVTAQLITASNGSHLWSQRYDRELVDVFAVQDEISAAISEALKITLSPLAAAKPRYAPTLPAHEALLKARHFHWNNTTPESMAQAELFHEQAIALDPQYALAHAEYAELLVARAVLGLSLLREVAPRIRMLAQRALILDPSLAYAHAPLGLLASCLDYDWQEAERQFALATPGGSGSPLAHFGHAIFSLLGSGRRQEAVEQLELAVQADPLHLAYRGLLALCLTSVCRYDDAEKLLHQSRELDPNYFVTNFHIALVHVARQRFAEALPVAEKTFSSAPWVSAAVGLYGGLLVREGEPDRGHEIVRALGGGEAYGSAKGLGVFHSVSGDIDAAAEWFEKGIEERDPEIPYYLQGVIGEPLRASPHWPRLAALMNLPATENTLAT